MGPLQSQGSLNDERGVRIRFEDAILLALKMKDKDISQEYK